MIIDLYGKKPALLRGATRPEAGQGRFGNIAGQAVNPISGCGLLSEQARSSNDITRALSYISDPDGINIYIAICRRARVHVL